MNTTQTFDTVVVGGGIIGLSAADALLRRGQRVLLLEQFPPAHDRGSSHGDGRIIRFAYPEAIYVEMAHLAYPAWDRLSERAEQPLYRVTGGLDMGPSEGGALHALALNFKRFDLPFERLNAAESNQRFPQFHLPEGSSALFQPGSGAVFADRAIHALWSLLARGGAHLRPHTAVVELDPRADGVIVKSADGTHWQAEHVVVAAGAWAAQLLSTVELSLPLTVTQEQVSYFPAPTMPDHTLDAMPVFIDYHQSDIFYGLPEIDIPGVKVAGHHIGRPRQPNDPLPLDEANTRAVAEFVSQRLPALGEAPTQQLRCLYTSTPDHDFILDRHPSVPQIVVGAGMSGHGFKFGPLLGELLADLVGDTPPPVSLDRFSLRRFESTDTIQELR